MRRRVLTIFRGGKAMSPQFTLRTFILSALLAGAASWFVTHASAQGYTLPESTPTETFPEAREAAAPWQKDCTTYRNQRDRLQLDLANLNTIRPFTEEIMGSEQRSILDIESTIDRLRGEQRKAVTAGDNARIKNIEVEIDRQEKERDDKRAQFRSKFRDRLAAIDAERDELGKRKAAVRQQIESANQAFNDCEKKLSEARKEPEMDEVLITQLLTALINQTQLEDWERGLTPERKEVRKKIRRSLEKTERQTGRTPEETEKMHDPTASAVGMVILEGAISGAVSGAINRSQSRGGGSPAAGGGSHPAPSGGCSGSSCRRF